MFPKNLKEFERALSSHKHLRGEYTKALETSEKRTKRLTKEVGDQIFIAEAFKGLVTSWKEYKYWKRQNCRTDFKRSRKNFYFILNEDGKKAVPREFLKVKIRKLKSLGGFQIIPLKKALKMKCPRCNKLHHVIDCEFPPMRFMGKLTKLKKRVIMCLKFGEILYLEKRKIIVPEMEPFV